MLSKEVCSAIPLTGSIRRAEMHINVASHSVSKVCTTQATAERRPWCQTGSYFVIDWRDRKCHYGISFVWCQDVTVAVEAVIRAFQVH